MAEISPSQGAALSVDFFKNPENRAPFSYTQDDKLITGCIDPRNPAGVDPGDFKVMVQTPGGVVGDSADVSIGTSVVAGVMPGFATAMYRLRSARPNVVGDAHYGCKYVLGQHAVLAEMADPSALTGTLFDRWSRRLDTITDVVSPLLPEVQAAASQAAERVEAKVAVDPEASVALVDFAGLLHPKHTNVYGMDGPNTSLVYSVNFDPHTGIDRNAKPVDPALSRGIQGYHNDLAASLRLLEATDFDTPDNKGLKAAMAAALILRSAATLTVVTGSNFGNMTFLESTLRTDGTLAIEDMDSYARQ